MDRRKVARALVFLFVIPADQLQRFAKLQHRGKLVLAVVTAEAGADKTADLPAAIGELHLVIFAALDDGVALGSVDTEVSDLIPDVIFVTALRNVRSSHPCP